MRTMLASVVLGMAFCLIVGFSPQIQADVIYQTDFPDPTDSIPADWSVLAGNTGSPGWFIDTGGDYRFNQGGLEGLTTYTRSIPTLGDYTVSTELRKSDGGASITGLIGRVQNANTFYHARLQANNQLQLYRFDNGAATQLGSTVTTSADYFTGQAWRLSMTFDGDTITSRLFNQDSKLMASITETDATYATGTAGLRGHDPSAYEAFSITTPTLLAYENFSTVDGGSLDDYSTDATIRNTDIPRTGFTGDWGSGGTMASSVDFNTVRPGLEYPGLWTTNGALESYRTSGSSIDIKYVERDLDYQFNAEDDLWVSYLFEFSDLGTANNGSLIEVELRSDATNRDLTLQIEPDGTGPNGTATLIGGGNSGTTMDLGILDANETHLLVMKIEPDGPNYYYDAISAWIDPDPQNLGLPDVTGFGVERHQVLNNPAAFDALRIMTRPQPVPFSFMFDEFRLATSASLALPVPEPSSLLLSLLAFSGLLAFARFRVKR